MRPSRLLCILVYLTPIILHGQMMTATQQKALNNYVEHANESVGEMEQVVKSLVSYYPRLMQLRNGKTSYGARYSCPVQLSTYYYDKALAEGKALGTDATTLNARLTSLQKAAEAIDKACKELDVYHKLEDYKQDQYAGAEKMITVMLPLFVAYRKEQDALVLAMEKVIGKYTVDAKMKSYAAVTDWMHAELANERAFLDTWTFNLNADIHTGWDINRLQKSIEETTAMQQKMPKTPEAIKYPASSQVGAFIENVGSILQVKRSGWDDYNAEAKKSDEHSNRVYSDLINYYNGTLVSFCNHYLGYARQDGYYGLGAVKYLVIPAIRKNEQVEAVSVRPFDDLPVPPLNAKPSNTPIASNQAKVLNLYVEFINECLRQSGFVQQTLHNLDSRASYLRSVDSFEGKGKMSYSYDNFKIPSSLYQELTSGSKALPPDVAKSLQTQAEVLMNILKEMEQLSGWLVQETESRHYEQDKLASLYQKIERYATLFSILDMKKELLYHDVRAVYDSHPQAQPGMNWIVSWTALRTLVDDDHGALLQAKAVYTAASTTRPETSGIDKHLREVLTAEYDNLKGIEKFGRNNGLCPYTPYEDIPETSRRLSEKLNQLPMPQPNQSRHPYQDQVYLYNNIVDDFNKFCDLSKLNLLKTIKQPSLFQLKSEGVTPRPEPAKPLATTAPATTGAVGGTIAHETPATPDKPVSTTKIVHDTVYVERRDTVYITDAELNNRSMEGYAINNLVLLLDVSGSMKAPDKLPLLKQAVYSILDMMRVEDQVSVVIYSGKAKVLLPPTSFREEKKIRAAIENLDSSGKTDAGAGIALAYKVADKNYIRGGNNRIVLATDGEFSIPQQAFEQAAQYADQDIFLSVFNFGKGSGRNLERLSAAAKGNYTTISAATVEPNLIRELKARKVK